MSELANRTPMGTAHYPGCKSSAGKPQRGIMKQLAFRAVAIVFVLSLFMVGASLRSLGQPYLIASGVVVVVSGVILAVLLLRTYG